MQAQIRTGIIHKPWSEEDPKCGVVPVPYLANDSATLKFKFACTGQNKRYGAVKSYFYYINHWGLFAVPFGRGALAQQPQPAAYGGSSQQQPWARPSYGNTGEEEEGEGGDVVVNCNCGQPAARRTTQKVPSSAVT